MEVFLIHGSCKMIFHKHDRCDKYNFYLFSLTKRRRQRWLCATVRFSWLNFSRKITLYQTYSQTTSKFLLQLFQLYLHSFSPTIMTKYFFKQLLFSAQPSHPLQTHLLALSHIQTLLSYLCSYTHSPLLPLFIHTTLLSYLCS